MVKKSFKSFHPARSAMFSNHLQGQKSFSSFSSSAQRDVL